MIRRNKNSFTSAWCLAMLLVSDSEANSVNGAIKSKATSIKWTKFVSATVSGDSLIVLIRDKHHIIRSRKNCRVGWNGMYSCRTVLLSTLIVHLPLTQFYPSFRLSKPFPGISHNKRFVMYKAKLFRRHLDFCQFSMWETFGDDGKDLIVRHRLSVNR